MKEQENIPALDLKKLGFSEKTKGESGGLCNKEKGEWTWKS